MGVTRKVVIISIVLVAVLLASTLAVADLLTNINTDEYTAQCQKIFNDARTQIEQIRNVTLTTSVTLHVITKQDAVNMWGTPTANADLTYILRQEKVYKNLFLMVENDSLYQANVDWTANWGAATVGRNDIYVIRENFNPFDPNAEGTFVHELTHIWQPALPYPTTFDEDKAHAALIEGDASFMGDIYVNMTKANSSPTPMATVNNIPVFLLNAPSQVHPIPDTIWKINFFAYDYGSKWVSAIHQSGGFATVNRAYQQGYMPSATSQILHSSKYFANETAQPVQAPRLADNSWTRLQANQGHDSDIFGEYFVQVVLQNHINQTVAQRAATGWMGDNFTYYERGNDYLFTWNIKWADSCEASDFYVEFHNMANNAGATDYGSCNWAANGRYLSITWDQKTNTTLVAGSNVQAATQASYFSFP
jgi:hypothetical protein